MFEYDVQNLKGEILHRLNLLIKEQHLFDFSDEVTKGMEYLSSDLYKTSVYGRYPSKFNSCYILSWTLWRSKINPSWHKDNNVMVENGETKAVFIFNHPLLRNIVVKIPFNHERRDYCALEVKKSDIFMKSEFNYLFAQEVYLCDVEAYGEKYPVYVQEFASVDEQEYAFGITNYYKNNYSIEEVYSKCSDSWDEDIEKMTDNEIEELYEAASEDAEYEELLAGVFNLTMSQAKKLVYLLDENEVNDIHDHNVGFTDAGAKFIDYSGYCGWSSKESVV